MTAKNNEIRFIKNNMIDLIPIAKKLKENEIEKEIINKIREMMDMPTESLEEIREEQIRIAKESKKFFVGDKAIFDYLCSCQVATLFWVLCEMNKFKDKYYKQ